MLRAESDGQCVYLVADRAVYRDQLLQHNQEKLNDIAAHIRTVLGREVPVRALTADEYGLNPGSAPSGDDLDSLLAGIQGPVQFD